jgi:hypothetical protein
MKQARPGADKAHLGRVRDDVRPLATLTVSELRARYADLFGEPSRSRNKPYLVKKVAWKQQERAEGGLSPRARARAAELAPKALERLALPRSVCYRAGPVASPILLPAAACGESERGRGRWARQHDTNWFTPSARGTRPRHAPTSGASSTSSSP